jgi:hypothetical protein
MAPRVMSVSARITLPVRSWLAFCENSAVPLNKEDTDEDHMHPGAGGQVMARPLTGKVIPLEGADGVMRYALRFTAYGRVS